MKVRGAYDKLFWIYKRLNNCAAPALASDKVSVVKEEVFLCAGHAKEATTKTSSLSGAGVTQLFNGLYIQNGLSHMHLGPSPFDSAPQTLRDMKLSFLGELPL